ERDLRFAKHFNIHVTNILGNLFNGEEANPTKDAELVNSDFLTGMLMKDATEIVLTDLEGWGKGKRKINYKMRDAAFSRQRYWGEPFPVKWINGIAYALDESELPLELPKVDEYKPGPEGEGPLANIPEWTAQHLETNTMPGYAGSSWYFLRYMDPHNNDTFCDRKVSDYWNQVDLYIGGTEHAVGHLLYSRLWTKVLYDLGYIGFDEPYKKLVNQGMIQGSSRFVYRITLRADITKLLNADEHVTEKMSSNKNILVSNSIFENIKDDKNLVDQLLKKHLPNLGIEDSEKLEDIEGVLSMFHVDVNIVDGFELNIESFKKWKNEEFGNASFILEDETLYDISKENNAPYICGSEVEKMSKSKFNTVSPDILVERYGADTFRMYEMFLGPVEQSKPWDTKGIEGVHRFLRKLWRMFFDELKGKIWNEEKATDAELKVLHRAIKKIEEDTERFSFNTAVSAFMVCVNELSDLKCNKREVLEPLLIMLTPYAPHIAEELWLQLGNSNSVLDAGYPKFESKYLVESSKEYPISINGKLRTTMVIALDAEQKDVEQMVLSNEVVQKWLEGKDPKKIIYVKNKMINIVL
ncbi:MAG: class I tRNA ligase family protein, partial [Panacibacter sp.]